MRLKQLDIHPQYSPLQGPIRLALQHLQTLVNSESVPWSAGQKLAAELALADAKMLLEQYTFDITAGKVPASRAMSVLQAVGPN
jgi:hypothetical protein